MANHPNRNLPYAVRCTPHYYSSDIFGRHRPYHLTDDGRDGRLVLLARREDAEAIATMMTPRGAYRLDNNQYAAPEYKAAPYRGSVKRDGMSLHAAMIALDLNYDAEGTRVTDTAILVAIATELTA